MHCFHSVGAANAIPVSSNLFYLFICNKRERERGGGGEGETERERESEGER